MADGHSQRQVLAEYPCFSKGAIGRHAQSHFREAVRRSLVRTEAWMKAREALAGTPIDDAKPESGVVKAVGELVEEAGDEARDEAEQEYQAPEAQGAEPGSESLQQAQAQSPPQLRQASPFIAPQDSPRSPIRAHEDLAGRMQRRVDSLDELGAIAHATAKAQPNAGNVRTAVNANAEAVKAFLIIGRVQGLVQDAPTVDARSVINLSGFGVDELRSMLDGLKAGSEALNP